MGARGDVGAVRGRLAWGRRREPDVSRDPQRERQGQVGRRPDPALRPAQQRAGDRGPDVRRDIHCGVALHQRVGCLDVVTKEDVEPEAGAGGGAAVPPVPAVQRPLRRPQLYDELEDMYERFLDEDTI